MAPYLSNHRDGVCLSVKLQPRASRNEIGEPLGRELKIKVTAPPVDSAANEALVRFLADCLDLPRANVELIQGHTSRHKRLLVRGADAASIEGRLSPPAPAQNPSKPE